MSYSHTIVCGHLGRDAEIRTLEGGRVATSFPVAYTESWKDHAGVKQERTTWFNCSYFTATTPGVAEYLRKGSQIIVTGRVSARAYLDSRQQPAASLELNVSEIRLLSTPRRDEQPATTPLPHPDTVPGDDLPF